MYMHYPLKVCLRPPLSMSSMMVWFMVFNGTSNNISVLLVEETGVPGENHRPSRKLLTNFIT